MNARAQLLLSVADDELILGWRDSEWTGIAPFLEEDVAFSSIAQNEIGHARALYELVGGRSEVARRELIESARMTDLVLRDRRERNVLLEGRRDARPFRVAPAEDQLVVSYLQKELLFLLVHGPP